MKNLNNNKILKTISLMLVIIFITNALIPIPSYADSDEELGGKLFKPVFKLFAGVGDLVIKGLQKIFLGNGDIKGDGISEIGQEGAFLIRYSPGVIFSNQVPGLDANFISPSVEELEVENRTSNWEKIGKFDEDDQKLVQNYGYDPNKATVSTTHTDKEWYNLANYGKEHVIQTWQDTSGTTYKLINTELDLSTKDYVSILTGNWGGVKLTELGKQLVKDLGGKKWTLYKLNITATSTGKTIESTAKQLQPTISKWYKALRMVSIVGLLSVLVYVGIRILISSTGQDKAKYKKMLADWVAAMCILFLLHYIMAFTMSMVEEITDIFKTNIIGVNGEDVLMTNIRQNIGDSNTYSTVFTDLILYIVLVIYTCMFTIHYLKRLVFLAFLTMIAPLIALTYPLDKIKDGQAQAFALWIREYVFNALIPVIHIVLYSIFVGSAMDFAQQNPLYAIICIGFLTQAEKFLRKMFGFDKASTVSQLGAAASGAMVMNAINKAGSKGSSKSGEGSGGGNSNPKGIRTQSSNPLGNLNTPPPSGPNPPTPVPTTRQTGPNPGPTGPTGPNSPSSGGRRTIRPPRAGSGVGNLVKNQLFTRKAAQRNLGALAGLGGRALGTTFGIAAGVATGDFSNAFKYGAAGFAAGGAAGKGIVNKGFNTFDSARKGIDGIAYGYNEGAYGTEYAQNRQFDKEFKRSKEYKEMVNKYKGRPDVKGDIQAMLNGGISDAKQMDTILNTLNTNSKYRSTSIDDAIGYSQLASQCSDSILYDDTKLAAFLNARGISISGTDLQNYKQAMIDFK